MRLDQFEAIWQDILFFSLSLSLFLSLSLSLSLSLCLPPTPSIHVPTLGGREPLRHTFSLTQPNMLSQVSFG